MRRLRNSVHIRPAPLLTIAALTGLAGIALLFFAMAATSPAVAVEPENSTQIAGATVVSNAAASGSQIFDKWYSRNDNIYRQNVHKASHWAFIAECLTQLTANATRLQRAQTVVDNINNHLPNYGDNSLRGQLQAGANNGYFWNDNWGSFDHPGHDVSHANGFMAYVVASNAMGGSWTTADLTKFANTLNQTILHSAGSYGDFVDGTGTGNGWFSDGFVKLGRVSPDLQKRLETHTLAQGDQMFGNGALNTKLLGAL